MRPMFHPVPALLLLLFSTAVGATDTFEGTWSAPSLSRPDTPIVIGLLPDGVATEQIGDYRGAGTWTSEDGSARIDWGKGWIGLLRPMPEGGYRLLTWKAGSPVAGPPDDDKPAVRVEPARTRGRFCLDAATHARDAFRVGSGGHRREPRGTAAGSGLP